MKEIEIKRDNITFQDNPTEFCKLIYEEALKRNNELRQINKENELFYEGTDKKLEEIENNSSIIRSAIFIHQLKPAIDARISETLSALEERENPVTIKPKNPLADERTREKVALIERTINEQLRESGYLTDIFKEQIKAAEIYRTPSTVKVDWEDVYEKKPVVIEPSLDDIERAIFSGESPPKTDVRWVSKYKGGKPVVEWIPPDQFLYEPNVSNFYKESGYAIHSIWEPWHKVIAIAHNLDWDMKVLNKYKLELEEDDETSTDATNHNKSLSQEIAADREDDTESTIGYRNGYHLINEIYVVIYSETGEKIVKQIFMIGNKYIVKQQKAPNKGIDFPFVPMILDRLPGTLEGLSSVDIGKPMQRLFNGIFNSYLDGVTYKMFPPILRSPGTTIQKQPVWGPGRIWDVTNPEGLKPLLENIGTLPNLPALMDGVAAMLRHILNAPDLSQGFQANQYEKATATKFRAGGSARRSMTTRKQHGQALIKVAEMFLALNQQYHPNKQDFVEDVVIDVPTLTNATDPETQKSDALLILSQALQLPMYKTPLGQLKLRNIWDNVLEKFEKVRKNDYIPSEQELKAELEIQKNKEAAMFDKQNGIEGLQLLLQSLSRQDNNQNPKANGDKNVLPV